jgi:hypothetical protein
MNDSNHSSSYLNLAFAIIRSRKFILLFASLVVLFTPIALATSSSAGKEKDEESFLSMITLGSSMKLDASYFPSNNSTVNLGDRMNWYIMVHNGMDNSEYVAVRVKILNSTQTGPNDTLNLPSPSPQVFEHRQLLARDSSAAIPLEWAIIDIDKQDGKISIKRVMINGQEIGDLGIESQNGQNFRMLLELWRYNVDTRDFEFEWSSSAHDNKRSVWNQIWFSMKN